MFAPPYSPNKKFAQSKTSLKILKKPLKIDVKHCLRCQVKSSDSKYFNKNLIRINPLTTVNSLKTLPNFMLSSSDLSLQKLKNTQKHKKKFEPFSTFGKTDSKKCFMSLKENKMTKESLSLQRFSKKVKNEHKIQYKKIVYSSTNIKGKNLVKKPGKKDFEKKNIYKLYASLKEKYEKLKAEYDAKFFGQHPKNQQNSDYKEKIVKQKQVYQNESVQQNYQIKTSWKRKSKEKTNKEINSQTSIQQEKCYEGNNSEVFGENQIKSLMEVEKEKEYYRQQCLGLEQQLQSVYTMVMELKKQIQVLNQKNEQIHYESFPLKDQKQLRNLSPIRSEQFLTKDSQIKTSGLHISSNQNSNIDPEVSRSGFKNNNLNFQISHLPTEQSIIFEGRKGQNQNIFKKIPQSRLYEEQGIPNYESRQTRNIREVKIQESTKEPIFNSQISTCFQQIEKKNPNESETTLTGSSGISLFPSLGWSSSQISQSYLYRKPQTNQYEPIQIASIKSEDLIKAPQYIQVRPSVSTISVNRYHSYCKKNCEMNQCKCLIEMMTVSSNRNI